MPSAPAKALAVAAASACLTVLGFSPAGAVAAEGECPNEALRVGFSAHLPDCRAYEVVTPEVGPLPLGNLISTYGNANTMDTWFSSPSGESVVFDSNGSIQDEDDNGRSDRYESIRTPAGWKMSFQGASGADSGGIGLAGNATAGGSSPDHRYSFWQIGASGGGTLVPGNYLFERDGGFSWLGTGSLGHDVNAEGIWMTADGSHVIFTTADVNAVTPSELPVQLEPAAPPSPIGAIYDRPVGGPTDVVSLLPGDVTPRAPAHYLGSSADGRAVAFEVSGTMYVRRDDATTQVAAYAQPGAELACDGGGGGNPQWLRNGVPIVGAKTPYTVQPADEGTALQCEVTGAGSTVSTSVPPTLITTTASPIEPPQLDSPLSTPTPANPTAGTLETCPSGEWSGSPTLAYRWYASGAEIAGATSSTYEVQGKDIPSTLQCSVSAQNSDGTVVAFSAAVATSPAPAGAATVPVVDVHGRNSPSSSVMVFSGASSGGMQIFYIRRGEVLGSDESFEVFDAADGKTTTIADEGAITPVNVSEDGSHAYFVSTAALSGSGVNSVGAEAEAGKHNLYVWDGSGVRFIAALNEDDMFSVRPSGPLTITSGLSYWTSGLNAFVSGVFGGPGADPSRSTPDGTAFVFQTSENLLPNYDSGGHVEIFRYDADGGVLSCVSCNPAGTEATANAELQTTSANVSERIGVSNLTHIPNITPDGETVVFETRERLLPTEDEDDFYDVYRWKAGELALVSSGQSSDNDFLFGMSADASDIFFKTFDSLVSLDHDGGNYSIYDARVDGGFVPPIAGPVCEGEGCQGGLAQAPALPSAATPTFRGAGNVSEPPRKKKRHKKKRHKHSNKHAHKAKKGGKR